MANPPSSPEFDWKMYRYIPSLAAAILFLVLFSILTLLHVLSYIRHHRTSIIYVILGGLCTPHPDSHLHLQPRSDIQQVKSLASLRA